MERPVEEYIAHKEIGTRKRHHKAFQLILDVLALPRDNSGVIMGFDFIDVVHFASMGFE